MATSAEVLQAEIRARDRASKDLQKVAGRFTDLGQMAQQVASGLGAIMAARAVVDFLLNAGKAAREFETGMAKVNTMLGQQPAMLEKLGQDVTALATSYGKASGDIQNAMYQALSAGIDAAEATEFMGVAAQAATGGMTTMETAVDGLTTVLNAYGMETERVGEIADAAFTAVRLGKTTFEEISARVGFVAPQLAALGISFDEFAAYLATVTKQGISTRIAITSLRQALADVIKPADDVRAAAEEMGVGMDAAAIQSKGLIGWLKSVAKATKGDQVAMARLIPSVEALSVVTAATSEVGLASLDDAMGELTKKMGAADEAAGKMADTTEHRLKKATEETAAAMRDLGQASIDVATYWEQLKAVGVGLLAGVLKRNAALIEYVERLDAVSEAGFHLEKWEREAIRGSEDLARTWHDARDAGKSLAEATLAVRDAIREQATAAVLAATETKEAWIAAIHAVDAEMKRAPDVFGAGADLAAAKGRQRRMKANAEEIKKIRAKIAKDQAAKRAAKRAEEERKHQEHLARLLEQQRKFLDEAQAVRERQREAMRATPGLFAREDLEAALGVEGAQEALKAMVPAGLGLHPAFKAEIEGMFAADAAAEKHKQKLEALDAQLSDMARAGGVQLFADSLNMLGQAFAEMAVGGEVAFGQLAASMLRMIGQMATQMGSFLMFSGIGLGLPHKIAAGAGLIALGAALGAAGTIVGGSGGGGRDRDRGDTFRGAGEAVGGRAQETPWNTYVEVTVSGVNTAEEVGRGIEHALATSRRTSASRRRSQMRRGSTF